MLTQRKGSSSGGQRRSLSWSLQRILAIARSLERVAIFGTETPHLPVIYNQHGAAPASSGPAPFATLSEESIQRKKTLSRLCHSVDLRRVLEAAQLMLVRLFQSLEKCPQALAASRKMPYLSPCLHHA